MRLFEGRKRKMIRRLVPIVLIAVVLLPLPAYSEKPGPGDTIKTFNAALLESMKGGEELGYQGRFKILEPVVKDSFALEFMGSQTVGKYWKTFKKDEQDAFMKTYTEYTIANYAGQFDSYSGQTFEVAPESEPVKGKVIVVSKLVRPNKGEVEFHYLLRQVEGRWRIVDIQISGVSQLALTRAQFTQVIKDKGLDGLISMLKEKIKGFSKKNGG
ncbi:MAG TPA: ABC transporter substrate-binding protein [Thermodesulfovibrionales bacterium]|nr:ABC transporter substrate-binding protein [Thermodesulfovibrionales bacterium]